MLGKGTWSTTSAAATGVLWLRRRGAGAEAVGVELDAALAKRATAAVAGLAGARIIHGDALAEPLDRATKIFLYLVPSGLKTIAPRLAALRNVTVVAYTFAVPGWAPDRREVVGGISLYLYLPRRVFACGACQLTLVGDAKFTYVDGPSRIEGTYTEDAGDFIFKWPSRVEEGRPPVARLRAMDLRRALVDEGIESNFFGFFVLHALPTNPPSSSTSSSNDCSAQALRPPSM